MALTHIALALAAYVRRTSRSVYGAEMD